MDDAVHTVTRLSGGWYMVEPMTRAMAELLHSRLDAEEMDELASVGCGRDEFVEDCLSSDRSAAFFACGTLVFGIAANWIDDFCGSGRRERLWDTMSTRDVRECGLVNAFVRHTKEMRDAFMIGEPTDSVIGIVKSDFARSRKWIERCCGFRERGDIDICGTRHTVYERKEARDGMG